jgi:hypothetical protein
MREFLTRNSSLQISFSRDSFGDQSVLCLAPSGESRWRPIFRTPADVS